MAMKDRELIVVCNNPNPNLVVEKLAQLIPIIIKNIIERELKKEENDTTRRI